MKKILLVLLAVCTALNLLHAITYYVTTSGNDASTGTSWGTAYRTVQKALSVAANGDQIWVAQGTYYPTTGTDRNISFVMKNGVAIYGGFNGTETQLSQRNWAANQTILSGNIGGAGNIDNVYRVINNSFTANAPLGNTAILDGFTVQDAYADGAFPLNLGGGMWNTHASPTIRNCIFKNNLAVAGGGIFNDNSQASVINCLFVSNTATANGSAIANGGGSDQVKVVNCTFYGNIGPITLGNQSNASFVNCIIWGNEGGVDGGTVTYSIVQGGFSGTGNFNQDPLFVDAPNGNLRLLPKSNAIDLGNNNADIDGNNGNQTIQNIATDLAGNPRIFQNTVDMGAYESTINRISFTAACNQYITIPSDGEYTFSVRGADGGDAKFPSGSATQAGGSGAILNATFSLQQGDLLTLVAGIANQGAPTVANNGGGGSAIVLTRGMNSTLLMVAGGGGGATYVNSGSKAGRGALSTDSDGLPSGGSGGSGGGGGGGGGGFNANGSPSAKGGSAGTIMGGSNGPGGFGFGGGGRGNLGGGGGGGFSGGNGGGLSNYDPGEGGTSFIDASGTNTIRIDGVAGGGTRQHGRIDMFCACTIAKILVKEPNCAITIEEGAAMGTYTVELLSSPSADVLISVNPNAQVTVDKPTLTFNSSNWNIPQTVTITAVDDNNIEGMHSGLITHVATSLDPNYNNLSVASITPTVLDNDSCPFLNANSASSYAICSGDQTSDISINVFSNNNVNIKLVYFTSAQTGTDMYSGGTEIGNSTSPSPNGMFSQYIVNFNNLMFPANNTSSSQIYYVYAIVDISDPELQNENCRPFVEFQVTVNSLPNATFGTYPNTSITAGQNATVIPNAAPTNTSSAVAYTNTNFTGVLTVNPTTGVVTVTDAKQAGIYTVTVQALNGNCAGTTATFTLTITDPTCSAGNFSADATVGVGDIPQAVAIGDFNGDGVQDLATANFNSHDVSIRLGDGLGGFSGSTIVGVGSRPASLAIGDFNGDGLQDLATANLTSDNVSIRLGNGLGGFSGSTTVGVGDGPYSIAIGDFNGDGVQDFATANYNSNNVSIRLGDGLGGFSGSTTVGVGAGAISIVIGDFNGDGVQDLAAASTSGNMSIRLGDGLGGFSGSTTVGVGNGPYSITIGDFNGDGLQDLATANLNSDNVSIRLGDGLGGFSGSTNVGVGDGPQAVVVGDFNGDGLQDLATANFFSNNVSIRFGDGLGGFSGSTTVGVGDGPSSLAIGDFNGDGVQDLATANSGSDDVSIHFGVANKINLKGNSMDIADGDNMPATVDHTDFGTTTGPPITRTFTIQNTGTDALNLAAGAITISGPDLALFSVSNITLPAAISGPNGSITFDVTYTPLAVGVHTATVNIVSDDCNVALYNFDIKGERTCPTFTAAPGNANITNSTCTTGCMLSGGTISAPSGSPCPVGSTLQYKVDNGPWTNVLPTYNQTTAQTIKTRCSCDADPSLRSDSSAVTTVPGTCPSATASIVMNNGPICSGTNAVFTVTGTNGATLSYHTGGGNQTLLLNGSNQQITVPAVVSNTTLNLVSVATGGGPVCTTLLSDVSTVNINPLPTASVSAATSPICAGQNAVFNLMGTANAEVTYTINNGGNQTVNLGSSGAATVTVNNAAADQTLNLVSVRNTSTNCVQSLSSSATVMVNPLPTASVSGTTSICQNGNATEITFSASGGTAPYTFTYTINNGNSLTISTTGNNTTATVSVPSQTIGVFNYTLISVQDASVTTCSRSISMNNVATVTVENCDVSIKDPCTCVNNAPIIPNGTLGNAGTFAETITVNAPTGQTWQVSAVNGLYLDAAATQAIGNGALMTETSPGKYTLQGYHIDAIGYSISVSNGRGVTQAVSNKCFYPNPVFTGLPALVAPSAAPFQVTGTVADNVAGIGTFILDGVPQAGASAAPTKLTINPGTLAPGSHTLVYSFDAGAAASKDSLDPGCVQQVRQRFQVANCGCQDVTVSLNENCQFLLTGNLVSDVNCGGGTVRVMDNDPSNGGLIDCAGVWTYGLFDAFGNIICWGKVTAEDKTAPALVCAPADVTLDCYDVNYVLNNRLTIGNTNATSSPRPAASGPQTINNAEGVAGTGDNCQLGLAPPSLVSDNIKNLGYAYFKDNCYNCGCRITLKWSDKVEFYSCEQMKVNGGYYAVISREWTATDCNGMRSSYVQKIKFTRPAIDDFVFNGAGEGKYDRVVEYNSCTPDKSLIKKEDVTPYVCSYFNTSANPRCLFIDQVECNYSVSIKDTEFPICGGKGVKIDRELYVLDWCAGGIVDTFHILIKIGDFQAPTVEYAHGAPFDISTGPMDCTAAIPVTVTGIKTAFGVTIKDNCNLGNISVSVYTKDRYVKGILVYEGPANPICTRMAGEGAELRGDNDAYRLGACKKEDICWEKVEYAVMNGMMIGLPVGKHLMVIDAFDGCYNASTNCFVFEVKDKIAPVMKCDDDLHVTLSNANGYTNGYAQVSAEDIDEGSWDNCKLAWIAVRRNVPDGCAASFIAKGYDTNGNGKLDHLPADGDWTKADGFDRNGDGDIADFGETFIIKGGKLMTPLLDYVEFFCCDLTERVTVELWGGDIYGNTNYCWMDLLIEDKVAPTCLAPWDVTIYCDDKNIGSIDSKVASAKIFGDVTIPTGNDCAALDTAYSTEKKLKCGAGYIDRIWTLTKQTAKGPISVTCKQRIHILPVHEYNICFPKDVSTDCKTPIIDTVITDELACDILAVNVSDKRYDASDDECYKIFRTYSVINWCTYDDRCGDPLEQTNIHVIDRGVFGNYGKDPIYLLVRDREDNRRDGNEEFWISKDLTVSPTTDLRAYPYYCDESEEYYHSFIYTQIIKVYDDTRPVVTGDPAEFCIREGADCLANLKMVITGKDNCSDKVTLETQYLMIAPNQTLDAGKMILYSTPRWSTKDLGNGQFEINVANLPEGKHDLIVVVRDECGNLSVATRIPFTVKDCKGPAPICINGLSTGIMPDGNGGGMMAVWASDFVASKIYDCNGQGPETKDGLKLVTKYSINRVGQPVNKDQTGLNFTCADIANSPILVELHAWDNAGNHDFCITFVELIDSRGVCPGSASGVNIAGTISTEGNANLQGASITLSGAASQNATTAANGGYSFINLTKGGDFTVTPQLDKNHLNGVSTFDLVLIQKHILGVQALNSPYKMIAADVNNSKSISTLDLIALRKLILNIDQTFQNNTSWRFVDASYNFPNANNPWSAAFPEVVSINDIASNVAANFVAIKVGDVNASASVNGLASAEVRTNTNFKLQTLEQNLKPGNEYRAAFTAEDLKNIQGYQFALTLDQNKVELLDIEYGVAKAENFGVFRNEGLITTSWNSKYEPGALFTLVLRAKADGKLSSALSLNRVVHPEAYDQHNENLGIALNFEGIQATEAYELKQNTPNPFSDETLIGFTLPKATKATLSIRDVKGALVYKVEGNYAKGSNQLTLKKSQLGASGVLYYTLETTEFTATKKMVILE